MTITLFVKPESLNYFLAVTQILQNLDIKNNYQFKPSELIFKETFDPDFLMINMEVHQYLKLKYCIANLKNK